MSNSKTVMSQAANSWAGPTYIEDVFSTYLYTGTGSTQTITNGIDLAGEGGLVWLKGRSIPQGHTITDTIRGSNFVLQPNTTDAQVNTGSLYVTAFNADGFSIGTGSNTSGQTFASWTFRKAPRFFDVVTYTGNGSNQQIAHNLGVAPGCIIVKNTGATANWCVYHRGTNVSAFNQRMQLNTTDAVATSATAWNGTVPTDTEFSVGNFFNTNASGNTYVAYLFAHDPLGPSEDGSDGLIACGSYTGNGSTDGPEIDLGWEPQWVMIKRTDVGGAGYDWFMFDAMRGMPVGGADVYVDANSSDAEAGTSERFKITPTGFQMATTSGSFNASGGTYIYIAIRRGPMRVPESGTEVFAIDTRRGSTEPAFVAGFPVDAALFSIVSTTYPHYLSSRLTNNYVLTTDSTAAETLFSAMEYDHQDGYHNSTSVNSNIYSHMFRRAPGFFDVVAYTGNGTAGRTVPHNLGVAPEMMIVKRRSSGNSWAVYHKGIDVDGDGLPETDDINLNSNAAASDQSLSWNDTAPNQTHFTVGNGNEVNNAAGTYIAYLFASLDGISKVGSYTGNGSSQTIDCGFTSGARLVLIKRTDSTGDWYVWDTARGIVTGNDPHLSLNTTAAQVTTNDSIDPASSGFIVNQVAATNINVSSASYIFYAIA